MRQFSVTLQLVVTVADDIDDDGLEEEIAYEVERNGGNAIMVDYHEESHE